MLDNKVFLQGINYLKANYLNWQFDINNDLMLKVWYKKFANLEANIFMGIVEKYTQFNKFGPQSPADLLEVLRAEVTQKELLPIEGWAFVRGLIQKYGFNYGRDKIYAELEDKPALKKTVEEFETDLKGLLLSDTYTPERFKKAYEINLKRQVEQQSNLLLGNSNTLFIE